MKVGGFFVLLVRPKHSTRRKKPKSENAYCSRLVRSVNRRSHGPGPCYGILPKGRHLRGAPLPQQSQQHDQRQLVYPWQREPVYGRRLEYATMTAFATIATATETDSTRILTGNGSERPNTNRRFFRRASGFPLLPATSVLTLGSSTFGLATFLFDFVCCNNHLGFERIRGAEDPLHRECAGPVPRGPDPGLWRVTPSPAPARS